MSQPDKPLEHPHVAEKVDQLREHPETTHVAIADKMDAVVINIGKLAWWLNVVLILVIITQVVLRYGFSMGMVVFEELQWHLYAGAMMLGIPYALTQDAHIRVDVLHQRFSPKWKRIVEIVGILLFLLPFAIIVFHHSLDFVYEAWRVSERSDAPTGLGMRWLIKGVIPFSFGLLIMAAVSRLIRDFTLLKRGEV
ncbi:TRAP transporter small permease subunit [Magnetococcus sp. PR-3]|uniref:TRAP transporter small permease subunit n=1 Tax=Magnetococcus sp. PR-3 TaxID=3120355 RepID=UPI002FCDF48B